jgi:uncharacterized protein YabN with tetrapyrrole methylase and pyrophosphatase domain
VGSQQLALIVPRLACMTHPRLEELIATLEQLRSPGGCAWDAEQTHASLVRYLIEETYELVDAIEAGSDAEMVEELGDVLYQVIFHSSIAAAEGRFTLEDVSAHMTAKMVGRHPHVFGDRVAETADDVVAMWDDLKRAEKPSRPMSPSLLKKSWARISWGSSPRPRPRDWTPSGHCEVPCAGCKTTSAPRSSSPQIRRNTRTYVRIMRK